MFVYIDTCCSSVSSALSAFWGLGLLSLVAMDALERLAKLAEEKSTRACPFEGLEEDLEEPTIAPLRGETKDTNFEALHKALDAVGVPRKTEADVVVVGAAQWAFHGFAQPEQPTYPSAPWHASSEVERSLSENASLEATRAKQPRSSSEVDVSEVERLRSEIASLEATQAEQQARKDEIHNLEALYKRHKVEMHAAHAKNLAELTAELTELGPLPPSGEPSSASQGVEPVAQSSHEEALPTASQEDSEWASGWYEQRYWRGSGQRYGARGSTRNPNVMWHNGRASALKRGNEYYQKWLIENPKPPNRAERGE
jgi:hypothetical protein